MVVGISLLPTEDTSALGLRYCGFDGRDDGGPDLRRPRKETLRLSEVAIEMHGAYITIAVGPARVDRGNQYPEFRTGAPIASIQKSIIVLDFDVDANPHIPNSSEHAMSVARRSQE